MARAGRTIDESNHKMNKGSYIAKECLECMPVHTSCKGEYLIVEIKQLRTTTLI